jgi:hypothetical protein
MARGLCLLLFVVGVVFTADAQSGAEPVVVIDDWWNVDYAKNSCVSAMQWDKENSTLVAQVGCDSVTSCPEMTPVVDACRFDPVGNLNNFETELLAQFASNAHCREVQIATYKGPKEPNPSVDTAMRGPHWFLSFNYIPGARKQSWTMNQSEHLTAITSGEGEPKEVAEMVCSIVTQSGAKILN